MIYNSTNIIGLRFNDNTIIKAYYNDLIVFSLNSNEDSVIGGFWRNDSLWSNEDLYNN